VDVASLIHFKMDRISLRALGLNIQSKIFNRYKILKMTKIVVSLFSLFIMNDRCLAYASSEIRKIE